MFVFERCLLFTVFMIFIIKFIIIKFNFVNKNVVMLTLPASYPAYSVDEF